MIHDDGAMRRLLLSDADTLAATRILLLTGDAGPEGYPAGERIELALLPWRRGWWNLYGDGEFVDDPHGRTFRFRGELRLVKGKDRPVNWAGGLLVNERIVPHTIGELRQHFGTQDSGCWEYCYDYTPPGRWPVTGAVPFNEDEPIIVLAKG